MSCGPALTTNRFANYSEIADEYYDGALHPTCASLRELSEKFLLPRITALSKMQRRLVEVGVGRSILAPAWIGSGGEASAVVLIDSAPKMLAHSAQWRLAGASLMLGNASALPFEYASVDVMVASLGDPYNSPAFWHEAGRVLRPGGCLLYTTPAREWSTCFRDPEVWEAAEFVRADGAILLMPSTIATDDRQIKMFKDAGLTLDETKAFSVGDLSSPPPPKLLCLPRGEPVLRGYALRRN